MPLLTVEEAAKNWDATELGIPTIDADVRITEESHSKWLQTAFKAGADWMIEQGIIWFTIHENVPPQRQRVLCCTSSGHLAVGYLEGTVWMYDARGAAFEDWGYTVTHFAYINTPKTDK